MAPRHIFFVICLWLTILTCFPGCDESDETGPLNLIQIYIPPDAEEAIIFLGSSPAQTVKIGEEHIRFYIFPDVDELGKTNMLLVQFKDSNGSILDQEIHEVYVTKSGQTDVNLQFVLITTPYIRVSLAGGEIGIKIDVKGWYFKPDEDIEIYLVGVQPDTQVASATEAAWASIRLQSKAEYQNRAPEAISISAHDPIRTATADSDGHFETTFEVPEDLRSRVLAGKTFVRVAGVDSGFIVEVQLGIASPYIYVEPMTGAVGTEVAVTGLNFGANEDVRIDFGGTEVTRARTDAEGSFDTTFRIPEDAPVKRTPVQVTGLKSGYTEAVTFNVSIRDIDVDPPVGVIGTEVTVKGRNFDAEEGIRIDFGDNEVVRVTTDAEGSFEARFPVPKSDPGKKSVKATEVLSGHEAEAQFAVFESRIYVDPPAGVVGSEVTVTGLGFGATEDIQIDFGDTEGVTQATTDAEGSFEARFPVPESDPGTKSIQATGVNSGSKAEFPFTIPVSSIYLVPLEGRTGTEVTVTGLSFGADEDVRIDFGGTEVTQARTNAEGSFDTNFTVPEDAQLGETFIRAIGLRSGREGIDVFTVIP